MEAKAKEKHVHEVFERIAPKYDFMNDLISFRRHKAWRRFALKKMNIQPGQTALDLCCGTCDWTIAIAERNGGAEVTGLDFSGQMLKVGRMKVERAGLAQQIKLVQGNAMDTPFADDTFDFVTIGFGLRNLPDYEQAMKEMHRVLKPGGRVVCLELSKPVWQPFKAIYYVYLRGILPMLGKLFAKSYEQYKWLPESLAMFPDHKELTTIFERAGFTRVEAYPLAGGIAALHIGCK
jgi:demethylmenaquinone methyltransferase/2-methoxy-6-polyprenyl-1,4-benzoquinol methylase